MIGGSHGSIDEDAEAVSSDLGSDPPSADADCAVNVNLRYVYFCFRLSKNFEC